MNKIIKLGILILAIGIWGCKPKTPSINKQEDIVILEKKLRDTISKSIKSTNIFDDISDEPEGSVPNKIVGGREYFYQNPRFRYNDPAQKFYIYERPKGIHTFRYLNIDESVPKDINAFKIEFYNDDNKLINTIDLVRSNPYVDSSNSKYLGEGRPGFLERSYSQLASKDYVNLLKESYEYYTDASVWESSDDYVIVDYSMVGRDRRHRYIGEEHTLVIINNKGDEIARVDKLYGWVRSGILSEDKNLLFFLQGDCRNLFQDALVIYDISQKKELYSSLNTNETYGLISNICSNENKCLYVVGVEQRKYNQSKTCYISAKYIDLNNRQVISACIPKDDFLSYKWPDGHFDIIEKFFTNKEKF